MDNEKWHRVEIVHNFKRVYDADGNLISEEPWGVLKDALESGTKWPMDSLVIYNKGDQE